MARDGGAEAINFEEVDVIDFLKETTGNRGPDSCVDAVGMEASGHSLFFATDRAKQALHIKMDRAEVLRQCIRACRKGGTVSVPGVYGGFIDRR